MKITIFCGSFAGGGAEKVAINLANYYCELGHDVSFLVLNKNGPYYGDLNDIIKVVSLECRARYSFLKLFSFLRKDKSDVILSVIRDTNIILGLSGLFLRKKIVFREANTLDGILSLDALKKKIIIFAMKIAYARANQVICNSEDTRLDLVAHKIINNKGVVIGNPVIGTKNSVRCSKDEICNRVKHKWLNGEYKVFLNVGRLHLQKNQLMLIDAFSTVVKEYPKARLIILGTGELREKLINFSKEHKIEDKIDIIDFVSDPYPYYRDCTAFVLSSKYEGFGNVIVEALSVGSTVISTDCPGGPKEILDNGKYGILVENKNPLALSAAMVSVIKENKSHFYEEAVKRSQDYRIENIATKYMHHLK